MEKCSPALSFHFFPFSVWFLCHLFSASPGMVSGDDQHQPRGSPDLLPPPPVLPAWGDCVPHTHT